LSDEQTETIANRNFEITDQFLRRIPPWHLKPDGGISSAAFQNDDGTDMMSVNWLKLSSVEHTLCGPGLIGFGVASISAGLCYSLNQNPVYSPDIDNKAHCDIVGHKTKTISRIFSKQANYLRYPVAPP
jgi:hypothetical protein